jgi:hypothetical protein
MASIAGMATGGRRYQSASYGQPGGEVILDITARHASGRKVRFDAFPMRSSYREAKVPPCRHLAPCGCDVATEHRDARSCCLRCPFELCRYDVAGGIRAILLPERDKEIRTRRSQGVGRKALAQEFGLTERNISRILAGGG